MLFFLVFLCLGQCAYADLKTGKIPNRLLLCWFLIFWGLRFLWILCPAASAAAGAGLFGGDFLCGGAVSYGGEILYGGWEPIVFVLRCLAVTVFLFPLFLFRMMGAGDVKLTALLAGVLGLRQGLTVIFFGLAAAAAWSVFYMARRRLFLHRIRYFLNYMMNLIITGEAVPYYDASRDGTEEGFCLAPFVFLGYVLWAVFFYL